LWHARQSPFPSQTPPPPQPSAVTFSGIETHAPVPASHVRHTPEQGTPQQTPPRQSKPSAQSPLTSQALPGPHGGQSFPHWFALHPGLMHQPLAAVGKLDVEQRPDAQSRSIKHRSLS
jgi:hypothetical protein